MSWNYGDVLDAVGGAVSPDAAAFIHGDRRIEWRDASRRMNNLARALLERGAKPGDKLAFYLRNGTEYIEGVGASFLARLVHVNVNYRYKPEEVCYILDNSDATALIYSTEFRECIEKIRDRLPQIRNFVEVTEGREPASFAEAYEVLAETGSGARLDIRRSADDMLFIYTGGTTGMPKGVMWRHGDLANIWHNRLDRTPGSLPHDSIEVFASAIAAVGEGPVVLPACPLMHGTGFVSAYVAMLSGGCVVTVDSHHFDPHLVWAAVDSNGVQSIAIVGDPFARPLLTALEEAPGHYNLTSMLAMSSSGAMWSIENKRGLIRHIPQLTITDHFSSTEAMGMGTSVVTKEGETRTAAFTLLEDAIVIDENDKPIPPGDGKAGLVALGGPMCMGYYKDPEKTARTFRTIGNVRRSIPGDWARVEADGTITLLGRGNNCINTAGEKVFPEEVEEALKTHPAVEDALVVGVPDEKWGQSITAVVVPRGDIDEEDIRHHVRGKLAGYKTPKRVLVAGVPLRAPNGKADYKGALDFAKRELGIA